MTAKRNDLETPFFAPFCHSCGERLPSLKNHAVACPSCGADLVPVKRSSQAWVPGLMSLLLPGAGQVFNGQLLRGVLIFATCWLIVPWIFGVIDAFATARRAEATQLAPQALNLAG